MMYGLFLFVFLCYPSCAFPALGWAWNSVSSLWSLKNEKIEEIPWTLSELDKKSNDLLESIVLYDSRALSNFGNKKIEEEMFLYDLQRRTPFDWALYTWKRLYKENSYWLFEADNVTKKLLECGASLDKYVAWQLVCEDQKKDQAVKKTYLEYIKEDPVLKKRVGGWLKSLIEQKNLATLPEAEDEKSKEIKRIESWKCWHTALASKPEEKIKPDEGIDEWIVDSDEKAGD